MKQNIRLAIAEAEKKAKASMLINSNDEDCDIQILNWDDSNGDFETVHSIISLYSSENIGGEGTEKEISDALMKIYPSHF